MAPQKVDTPPTRTPLEQHLAKQSQTKERTISFIDSTPPDTQAAQHQPHPQKQKRTLPPPTPPFPRQPLATAESSNGKTSVITSSAETEADKEAHENNGHCKEEDNDIKIMAKDTERSSSSKRRKKKFADPPAFHATDEGDIEYDEPEPSPPISSSSSSDSISSSGDSISDVEDNNAPAEALPRNNHQIKSILKSNNNYPIPLNPLDISGDPTASTASPSSFNASGSTRESASTAEVDNRSPYLNYNNTNTNNTKYNPVLDASAAASALGRLQNSDDSDSETNNESDQFDLDGLPQRENLDQSSFTLGTTGACSAVSSEASSAMYGDGQSLATSIGTNSMGGSIVGQMFGDGQSLAATSVGGDGQSSLATEAASIITESPSLVTESPSMATRDASESASLATRDASESASLATRETGSTDPITNTDYVRRKDSIARSIPSVVNYAEDDYQDSLMGSVIREEDEYEKEYEGDGEEKIEGNSGEGKQMRRGSTFLNERIKRKSKRKSKKGSGGRASSASTERKSNRKSNRRHSHQPQEGSSKKESEIISPSKSKKEKVDVDLGSSAFWNSEIEKKEGQMIEKIMLDESNKSENKKSKSSKKLDESDTSNRSGRSRSNSRTREQQQQHLDESNRSNKSANHRSSSRRGNNEPPSNTNTSQMSIPYNNNYHHAGGSVHGGHDHTREKLDESDKSNRSANSRGNSRDMLDGSNRSSKSNREHHHSKQRKHSRDSTKNKHHHHPSHHHNASHNQDDAIHENATVVPPSVLMAANDAVQSWKTNKDNPNIATGAAIATPAKNYNHSHSLGEPLSPAEQQQMKEQHERELEKQEKKKKRRFMLVSIALLVLLILIFSLVFGLRNGGGDSKDDSGSIVESGLPGGNEADVTTKETAPSEHPDNDWILDTPVVQITPSPNPTQSPSILMVETTHRVRLILDNVPDDYVLTNPVRDSIVQFIIDMISAKMDDSMELVNVALDDNDGENGRRLLRLSSSLSTAAASAAVQNRMHRWLAEVSVPMLITVRGPARISDFHLCYIKEVIKDMSDLYLHLNSLDPTAFGDDVAVKLENAAVDCPDDLPGAENVPSSVGAPTPTLPVSPPDGPSPVASPSSPGAPVVEDLLGGPVQATPPSAPDVPITTPSNPAVGTPATDPTPGTTPVTPDNNGAVPTPPQTPDSVPAPPTKSPTVLMEETTHRVRLILDNVPDGYVLTDPVRDSIVDFMEDMIDAQMDESLELVDVVFDDDGENSGRLLRSSSLSTKAAGMQKNLQRRLAEVSVPMLITVRGPARISDFHLCYIKEVIKDMSDLYLYLKLLDPIAFGDNFSIKLENAAVDCPDDLPGTENGPSPVDASPVTSPSSPSTPTTPSNVDMEMEESTHRLRLILDNVSEGFTLTNSDRNSIIGAVKDMLDEQISEPVELVDVVLAEESENSRSLLRLGSSFISSVSASASSTSLQNGSRSLAEVSVPMLITVRGPPNTTAIHLCYIKEAMRNAAPLYTHLESVDSNAFDDVIIKVERAEVVCPDTLPALTVPTSPVTPPAPVESPSSPDLISTPTTSKPDVMPKPNPATAPTDKPTLAPTTKKPTSIFSELVSTPSPTQEPTPAPTSEPTSEPTPGLVTPPTSKPEVNPKPKPTTQPTLEPSNAPTSKPTLHPSPAPTQFPTPAPSPAPSTKAPTPKPTTETPTISPSLKPTSNTFLKCSSHGNGSCGGSSLQLMEKCSSSDSAANDNYGHAVAVTTRSNNDIYAIVGARNHERSGSAYLLSYDRPTSSWEHVVEFVPGGASVNGGFDGNEIYSSYDQFGSAVAISPEWVVVAAPFDTASTGRVSLFWLDSVSSGGQLLPDAELVASDKAYGTRFGSSVAISGNTLVVGAERDRGKQGSAYVFKYVGGKWTQVAKLAPDDASVDSQGNFGVSVALSDGVVIVGAPYDGTNGRRRNGSVYVYSEAGSSYALVEKIVPFALLEGDQFGYSIAVESSKNPKSNAQEVRLAIGARFDDDKGQDSGSVYTYLKSDSSDKFTFDRQLLSPSWSPGAEMGTSLSMNGRDLIVGAKKQSGTGSAYHFRHDGTSWKEMGAVTPSGAGGSSGDEFGSSLSLTDDVAVVGSFSNDEVGSNGGTMYSYAVCT